MNEEWKIVRLGDYISIRSGLAYKGDKIGKGNALLLGMGCVSFKDKFVDNGMRLYNDDKIDEVFCVAPGDIVLATRQQSDNLPILGMPAIIPETLQEKKIIFGTNLYKVDNISEISNRFLFWLLKHQHYINYIAGVKSGTAVQMVTKKNIENYKFMCPPKEQREKIADILWYYDELIEINNKSIKIFERTIEKIYKEWFVRFRFPEFSKEKFKKVKPYGWIYGDRSNMKIPSKWHIGSLEEVGKFVRGKNITSNEMKTGEIAVISAGIEPSGYHNDSNVKGFSLTMSASGANAGYLKYNLEDIWAADCSYYQNDDNIWFVYSTLKFIEPAIKNLQIGSAQPHVYAKNINKLNIIIPEDRYIKMYNSFVNPIFEEIKKLNEKNKILIKQRDLLLPRLMSGKLKVK